MSCVTRSTEASTRSAIVYAGPRGRNRDHPHPCWEAEIFVADNLAFCFKDLRQVMAAPGGTGTVAGPQRAGQYWWSSTSTYPPLSSWPGGLAAGAAVCLPGAFTGGAERSATSTRLRSAVSFEPPW